MGGIFLSYRRNDSSGHTGRLTDDLREAFPEHSIFRDIDGIAPGADFTLAIDAAVSQADAVLAVIGRHWVLPAEVVEAMRVGKADDYVQMEIVAAIKQGKLLIPVLVDGADVPRAADLPEPLQPLVRHNAIEISDQRWKYDVDRLASQLRREFGLPPADPAPVPAKELSVRRTGGGPPPPHAGLSRRGLVGAGCVLLVAALVAVLLVVRPSGGDGSEVATGSSTTVASTTIPAPTTSAPPVEPDPAPVPNPRPEPKYVPPIEVPAPTPTTTPPPVTPPPTVPQPHAWPDSPNGRYRAVASGVNFQVVDLANGTVVFATHDEYREDNEVQVAAFSADSTVFAAAYHYSHDGLYTWIGYWSTTTGAELPPRRVNQLLYTLAGQV